MNQDQRKFLLERINKTYEQQARVISNKKPDRPSLNNYLIAAFLDNSIELASLDALKAKIRARVLKMGAKDVLIKQSSKWDSKIVDNIVEIEAEDIFILPAAYIKALKEYEEATAQINEELHQLEAHRDTLTLKIQIGSNQILDKLITQVDNLADINIMNSQFLLSPTDDQKQIGQ